MSGDENASPLREAARWYAELQDESTDRVLWQRFLDWERRPGNAAAFREIEAALSVLDRTGAARKPAPALRASWPIAAGIAAALLLAAVVSLPFLASEPAAESRILVHATGIGEQAGVDLADGSSVFLNTASRIEVDYSASERRITLVEGQALFEVKADGRPFIVAAGTAETRALGTRFEVYLPPGGLRVTLLEGQVSVSGPELRAEVILAPGEQATYRAGALAVAEVDADRAVSWRTGMVPFTDATLGEAAAEMNRYSVTQLRIDSALTGERLSGSFRAGDPEAFAAALEVFLPVRAERHGDEILIRPAG